MPKKLNGTITDPEWDDHIFVAEQYISPAENTTLNGDWWVNLSTGTREISPGRGLCLWSFREKDRPEEDAYSVAVRNGHSMKSSLLFYKNSFEKAKEGGFFFGSKYDKIIKSCKESNVEIDDVLIMTEVQEKQFANRVNVLLPNLEKAKEAGEHITVYPIDECFRDRTHVHIYDGIALIHGLKKIHPSSLWFNLDRGDRTIGNKEWTILLRRADYGIRDELSEGKFKQIVEQLSSLWNEYTMKKYLQDYESTIGKKIAQFFDGGPFDCNHHVVFTPLQIPENWIYKDGEWYRRKEERDTSGSTYGLIDLFFSI